MAVKVSNQDCRMKKDWWQICVVPVFSWWFNNETTEEEKECYTVNTNIHYNNCVLFIILLTNLVYPTMKHMCYCKPPHHTKYRGAQMQNIYCISTNQVIYN